MKLEASLFQAHVKGRTFDENLFRRRSAITGPQGADQIGQLVRPLQPFPGSFAGVGRLQYKFQI